MGLQKNINTRFGITGTYITLSPVINPSMAGMKIYVYLNRSAKLSGNAPLLEYYIVEDIFSLPDPSGELTIGNAIKKACYLKLKEYLSMDLDSISDPAKRNVVSQLVGSEDVIE